MTRFEDKLIEPLADSPGGLIETVKKGIIVALQTALTGSSITSLDDREVTVNLEYPLEKESYPGIWVQFSISSLRPSGIAMMEVDPETGDRFQQFMYEGRATIVVVALTSLERDRISDFLINKLVFSREPNPRVFTENGVAEEFTSLYASLDENPHLSMSVNTDSIRPGGQSISVGTAWDPTVLAYEDAWSFEAMGEFQLVTTNEGFYRLRRIDILPEVGMHTTPKPGDWM